jgi:hypothetical protein
MTKISNQYSLTNILTADLANSRLGINNVSPTVALDVTGAGKFSTTVTAGGNIVASGTGNITIQAISSNNFPVIQLVDNRVGGGTWNFEGGRTLGNLALRDSNAGIERMTWTSAGNVGIGTTSPTNFIPFGYGSNLECSGGRGGGFISSNSTSTHKMTMSVDGTGNVGMLKTLTNHPLMFATNDVERMRITSAGNVGIGTTSPLAFTSYTIAQISNTAGAGLITESTTGSILGQFVSDNGFATGASLVIGSRSNHPFVFVTNNTERMRITSGGDVGIGTTSPSARLGVSGNGTDSFAISINAANSTANGMTIYLPGNRSSDTTYRAISLGDDSAVRFRVFGNGNVQNTNGSYGTISDISIKENITDATEKLSDILKLKVRNFNFIGETNKQIGFIAQELEQVFPKLIDIDGETKLKSVKTSILIPMLVKSIQELSAKITLLENK